jgi:peptidoglycan/xylan/chitin deacetylase (PgdA/CDA1 family)
MPSLFLTIDVEEPPHAVGRSWQALNPLLTALNKDACKATFFVVGKDIKNWHDNLRVLANEGHEIAIHGSEHVHLNTVIPEKFLKEMIILREQFSDITGEPPVGFRAPYFSLTRETPWLPDALKEAGFAYSSSVLPARNPQSGFNGLPVGPFKWPNGLLEFPVPVFGFKGFSIPVSGGAYLRLLPQRVIQLGTRKLSASDGHWAYAHPYDFDIEETFSRWDNQGWIVSKLLHARRQHMLVNFLRFADPSIGPLASAIEMFNDVKTFNPW